MPDSEPMRVQELTRGYEQLQSNDRQEAQLCASRLVALFPLDREVRILAARVALELGNRESAGAHLFMAPGGFDGELQIPGLDEARDLIDEFTSSIDRSPIGAFMRLELRDVPQTESLDPALRSRLDGLLARLAEADYSRKRLDAQLYASRRKLTGWDLANALGCVACYALACAALLSLALYGLVALIG